jgi:hypothetical protein
MNKDESHRPGPVINSSEHGEAARDDKTRPPTRVELLNVIARSSSFPVVSKPRVLDSRYSVYFCAYEHCQMMKEQAGETCDAKFFDAIETCRGMWNLCMEYRRP